MAGRPPIGALLGATIAAAGGWLFELVLPARSVSSPDARLRYLVVFGVLVGAAAGLAMGRGPSRAEEDAP